MSDTKARAEPTYVARGSSWCARRPHSGACTPVVDIDPPPARPDPAIYSQAARLAAGATVTWDNPDIVVYATPQLVGGSYRIDPQWFLTNVLVTVRNNSTTAAAINTAVAVSYSEHGIRMPRTPLTTFLVSLAAGEVRQLGIPLPQSILNQPLKALSLFVDLSNPYDADVTNNQGESSSAISLIAGAFPTGHSIRIGNVTADPITYSLSVEPNTLGVTLSATQLTVAPGSFGVVTANHGGLQPPAHTSFTVVARDPQGNLAGGFTWILYFG